MRKTLKRMKPYLGFMTAIAVLVLALVGFGYAQTGVVIQNIENAVFGGSESPLRGDGLSLGGTSHFTSDAVFSGTADFDSTVDLNATTTIQERALGSRFSKALSFTAANTTTPGSLVSLPNTGSPKICFGIPVVELTSQVEGSMNFSFGTSTSATLWSASGGSLIGTTTVATGSAGFISANSGTNFGRSASTSVPWLWNAGHYILGAFDIGGAESGAGTRNNASSSDYTTAAGEIYLDCITR